MIIFKARLNPSFSHLPPVGYVIENKVNEEKNTSSYEEHCYVRVAPLSICGNILESEIEDWVEPHFHEAEQECPEYHMVSVDPLNVLNIHAVWEDDSEHVDNWVQEGRVKQNDEHIWAI